MLENKKWEYVFKVDSKNVIDKEKVLFFLNKNNNKVRSRIKFNIFINIVSNIFKTIV